MRRSRHRAGLKRAVRIGCLHEGRKSWQEQAKVDSARFHEGRGARKSDPQGGRIKVSETEKLRFEFQTIIFVETGFGNLDEGQVESP